MRSIIEFTMKSIVVTLCVAWLIYNFCPRYECVDGKHVIDKINGTYRWVG